MPAATRTEAPERYSAADACDSDSDVEFKTTLQEYIMSKPAQSVPRKTQRQVDMAGFDTMVQLPSKRAAAFIQQELEAAARARQTTTSAPSAVPATTTPTPTVTTTTTTAKSSQQPVTAPTPSTSGVAPPQPGACGRAKSTRRHRKPLDNYIEGEDGDWVVLPKDGLPAAYAVWVR